MKQAIRSLKFSLSGLLHAIKTESNLRYFLLAHIIIITGAIALGVDITSIIFTLFFATFFVCIELLNIAIERLADTIDDVQKIKSGSHYHPGIKMAKDVGASAALVALLLDISMLILIYAPYAFSYFR